MRIKLDENLPAILASDLARLGHDIDTVPREGLKGHLDTEIWEAAQRAWRFLITQDLDFSDATLRARITSRASARAASGTGAASPRQKGPIDF